MNGILGTRGDLLSDLLILALIVVLPSLSAGIWLARKKRFIAHRTVMMSIFSVLVLYVIIYEANLALLGGINYLRENIRMSEVQYFTLISFHVALSAAALILGGIAMRKGEAVLCTGKISGSGYVSPHKKVVWIEVALLTISVVTGVLIYYLTFIY